MDVYLLQNQKQFGPYTFEKLADMVSSETVSTTDLIWHEGLPDWQPLSCVFEIEAESAETQSGLPFIDHHRPPAARTLDVRENAQAVETNVQQGAIIGGLLCFACGTGLMFFSLWAFYLYGPLFLVAFILSIVAMAQRRVFGGIALLLATLIVPPSLFFVISVRATAQLMKEFIRPAVMSDPVAKESSSSNEGQETSIPTEHPTATTISTDESNLAPAAQQRESNNAKCAALDAKNGFRNVHLGMPASAFGAVPLEQISVGAEEQTYRVKDVDMKIGGAELSDIKLVFSEGVLREIDLETSGDENTEGLRDAFIAAYGQPRSDDHFLQKRLVWDGVKTHLALTTLPFAQTEAAFTNDDVTASVEATLKKKADATADAAKADAAEGAKNL